ncbi:DUF2268 domain-containing putative Zn-dependent protease [Christiangramia sp. SM2212]|uniref:DUF2268 domain-containing putative Zn-dependent protease n=1 Tax=Christiangramia sediminicola TaxID=3073267 RepID=A0ABU1EKZ5_9FLAO|nr:DUF2268 domain-containing putative Zn-dependent protease [Christiangramia sp. SM2212]MDR5589057.1 DUF2268 domain-containing putative Zn-dependent protease [Christiangramia sp. SM2212]
MQKKNKKKLSLLLLLLILVQSCSIFNSRLETSENPKESNIITSDIENFYQAFDLATKDSANAESLFNKYYFKKGSPGLNDFYKTKIQSKEKFTEFVLAFEDYYQSIKKDISNLNDLGNQIDSNFQEFENLYPQARFPDVYFLVGKFQSNGTISNEGLLIGTEMLAKTPDSDTVNWNEDILRITLERKHIPITVSHEIIHFNQDKMKDGNTLLWKSIREGSAEFIAELIGGETDADYSKFKGREMEIWNDFKKEKNKSIWRSWQQESEERPRNAGYWMGYIICKAYYEQIQDPEKTVQDILSIEDYSEFLRKSKVEQYIQKNFGT